MPSVLFGDGVMVWATVMEVLDACGGCLFVPGND
jgi:hypothetical protein